MSTATQELIEHVGGEFGATAIYTVGSVHVAFVVVEVTALDDTDTPLYERKGSGSSEDHVSDPHEAEPMFRGSVKWDGCSHIYFGDSDNDGYLHLCGRSHFAKLAATLATVYERCGELMKERGAYLLEGEFACGPK